MEPNDRYCAKDFPRISSSSQQLYHRGAVIVTSILQMRQRLRQIKKFAHGHSWKAAEQGFKRRKSDSRAYALRHSAPLGMKMSENALLGTENSYTKGECDI